MLVKTEDYSLIPHCDYETCDLGHVEYTCPNCKKVQHDYDDLWFQHSGKCHNCGTLLELE